MLLVVGEIYHFLNKIRKESPENFQTFLDFYELYKKIYEIQLILISQDLPNHVFGAYVIELEEDEATLFVLQKKIMDMPHLKECERNFVKIFRNKDYILEKKYGYKKCRYCRQNLIELDENRCGFC